MPRDDTYVLHIVLAARKIIRVTAGMTESDFVRDDVVQDSVIRQISMIGEAARNISEGFREIHDAVPWHEMIGMRHRLIHDYTRIDLGKVWETVQNNIPEIIRLLEPLVPPED
jgi:uncharacterized protein with HEPN domain